MVLGERLKVLLFGLTGHGNPVLRALSEEGCDVLGLITRTESGRFPHYTDLAQALGHVFFLKEKLSRLLIKHFYLTMIYLMKTVILNQTRYLIHYYIRGKG